MLNDLLDNILLALWIDKKKFFINLIWILVIWMLFLLFAIFDWNDEKIDWWEEITLEDNIVENKKSNINKKVEKKWEDDNISNTSWEEWLWNNLESIEHNSSENKKVENTAKSKNKEIEVPDSIGQESVNEEIIEENPLIQEEVIEETIVEEIVAIVEEKVMVTWVEDVFEDEEIIVADEEEDEDEPEEEENESDSDEETWDTSWWWDTGWTDTWSWDTSWWWDTGWTDTWSWDTSWWWDTGWTDTWSWDTSWWWDTGWTDTWSWDTSWWWDTGWTDTWSWDTSWWWDTGWTDTWSWDTSWWWDTGWTDTWSWDTSWWWDTGWTDTWSWDTSWWWDTDNPPIILPDIHVLTDSQRSPIYPTTPSCSIWFSELWIYSNIFSYTTIQIPYNLWNISLTVENISWWNSYAKKMIINWDEKAQVIYKTLNPDINYNWLFTICVKD